MPVHNSDIAKIFREFAELLEIQGANRFRVRAYENAARTIETYQENLRDIAQDLDKLKEVPGIGDDLAKKIQVIVETGELPQLDKLKQELPPGLLEMLQLEGLGPKRVKRLYEELGVTSIAQLQEAAKASRIQKLDGFGEKIEQNILDRIEAGDSKDTRTLRVKAQEVIEPLMEYLRNLKEVKQLEVAGSYRRCKETVGDIDLLVTGTDGERISNRFVKYEDVDRILNQGETKSSVILRTGLQVDLRIVEAKSFGAALQYFTGSREHNIALRQRAIDQGFKLNEYGLFEGEEAKAGAKEESVYQALDLAWIPPELRENRGEIAAAQRNELPQLIKLDDLRGDLQMHTTESDGHASIKEMAEAAVKRGYEYIAITDHSQHLRVANGLDAQRFKKQWQEIDEFNANQTKIKVLKAAEVDILADGKLDLDESTLKQFDLILASIHSNFSLSEEEQTNRVLRAMESPYFHIFAHPTGRLLNRRDPYAINMEKVIQKAKDFGVILEINAQPTRLDLNDLLVRQTVEAGVKLSFGTDAHSPAELDYMQLGVDQARRGWAQAKDIVNTLSWNELKSILRS